MTVQRGPRYCADSTGIGIKPWQVWDRMANDAVMFCASKEEATALVDELNADEAEEENG